MSFLALYFLLAAGVLCVLLCWVLMVRKIKSLFFLLIVLLSFESYATCILAWSALSVAQCQTSYIEPYLTNTAIPPEWSRRFCIHYIGPKISGLPLDPGLGYRCTEALTDTCSGNERDIITGSCVTIPPGQSLNQISGSKFQGQSVGKLPAANNGDSCPKAGNPINPGVGNKFQIETDVVEFGDFPLSFTRTYNSSTSATTTLGVGWQHSYERFIRLLTNSGAVEATRPDGKAYLFTATNGVYSAANTNDTLQKQTDGNWTYVTSTDETEIYSDKGQLLTITDRSGFSQTLAYTNTSETGQLTSITDTTYNRQIQLGYDSNNRINTLTDPAGGLYQYAYDTNNNLTSVTYPDGKSKTYHYENTNFPHALTGITDENIKRYATYAYDSQGRATLSQHAGGAEQVSLAYNTDGTTTVTDALNTVRTYSFQTLQGVVKATGQSQPGGAGCGASASAIQYDANGNVTRRADFNGNTTCYAYDVTRNLETARLEGLAPGKSCPADLMPAADTAERKITTQWHPTWRVPTLIAEPNRKTKLDWGNTASQCNVKGLLCGITLSATQDNSGSLGANAVAGESRTWSYGYNLRGQLQILKGPRYTDTNTLDKTTYTYYAYNDPIVNNRKLLKTVTDSEGHVTTYTNYDANGHPTQIKAANGVVTDLSYTARGQLQTLTTAGRMTRLDYFANGLLNKLTTQATGATTYSYDDAHRLLSISNAAGEKITYTLDLLGNRTQENTYVSAATTPTTAVKRKFDALGRLWRILNADSQYVSVFNYDAQGNPSSRTDYPDDQWVNHQTTDYTHYDALNRLTQLTDAINGLTAFAYDQLDHLASVKDPRNNITDYVTNGLDNLKLEDSPDRGLTQNTTYDAAGNLITSLDALGNTATYNYDGIGRLLSASYHQTNNSPDVLLNYRYDGNPNPINSNAEGQLSHIDDPSGATDWSYDSEGRLQSKSQTTGTLSRSLSYSYNSVSGRLDSITYPSGVIISYGYDSAGRPKSLSYKASATTTSSKLLDNISYQPLGPANSYQLASVIGLPTITRHIDSNGYIDSYTLNDVSKTLSYDRLGNLKTLGDVGTTSNDQSYSYDPLNRLTDFVAPGISQHYNYDATGNRTSKTINNTTTAYLPETTSNRLDSVNSTFYYYDAVGNLTSDGSNSYSYDGRNRLTYAKNASGAEYRYGINALGQRVSKTSSALSTGGRTYAYDEAGHLIGEYDSTGARVMEHIWLGDQAVAVIGNGGGLYYVLSDHLNTPRQIIDGNKQLRWRWDNVDPFGANAANNSPQGLSAIIYNLRFPGQYADVETGLFYNGFRNYDKKGGGYTQSDPIGLRGGVNTYAYVGGNPVRWVDPFGLEVCASNGQRETCTDGMRPPPEGTPTNGPLSPTGVAATVVEAGFAACPIGRGARIAKGGDEATGFLGSKRLQLQNAPYQQIRNSPTMIGGRDYSAHSLDQMQNRGIMPSVVENTIQNGVANSGKYAGSSQYLDSANNLRVIVNSDTGRVVTVIPGVK